MRKRRLDSKWRSPYMWVLGLVSLVACRDSTPVLDNSVMVVEPGIGITNVFEVGMTFSQVKQATGTATMHSLRDRGHLGQESNRGRFVLVPSLGAIAAIGTDEPISLIEFYVQPHKEKLIPELEIQKPFQGSLAGAFSFKVGGVNRKAVEDHFGSVGQVATNAKDAIAFRLRKQSFVLWRSDTACEIWYPHRGIAFVLTNDALISFQVFKSQ